MTREIALQIMGMSDTASIPEIKKRYRSLMMMTHPDMLHKKQPYPYDASEINVAYEYLLAHDQPHIRSSIREDFENQDMTQKSSRLRWNAPVNENAYAPRFIYHYVEDAHGSVLGEARIDYGKYIWTEDEDFPLFLKSILECSRSIIQKSDERSHCDRSDNIKLLSEISYLLAQQFVDSDMVCSLLANDIEEENQIYEFDAMLESTSRRRFTEGESLFPSRISSHRLYVKDKKEKEIGYISFKDDRMYYGIVPLFERRTILVKMVIKDGEWRRLNGKKYMDIAMYLKKNEEDKIQMLENINLKIEDLLKKMM